MSSKRSMKKDKSKERPINSNHIKYLIGLSLISKIIIVLLTTIILGSYMDLYLTSYYYEHTMSNLNGSYTYIDYYYEYPILIFIPSIIALIPSLLLNSMFVFILTFSFLMILCDCITTLCVYLIANKLFNDSKKAFLSAFIYITAISTAYFAVVDYAAFPTCLLMIGLTALFYGKEFSDTYKLNEYSAIIFGYFTKIFPAIALPFIILYKSKTTSLRQEIISTLKIFIPVTIVLFLPAFILNPPSVIKTYFPVRMDIGYSPNTVTWTVYTWLHDIFNIVIKTDTVQAGTFIVLLAGILSLLYFAFKFDKQDPFILLKFVVCGIMLFVFSYKVRSPTYILWFTPIICILICNNIYKIVLFYITQILAYIEYPFAFWSLWTNVGYSNPVYSANWYLTLIFFTIELSLTAILLWYVMEPVKLYKQIFKNN